MSYGPRDISWIMDNSPPDHEELFLAMYNGSVKKLNRACSTSNEARNTELSRITRERILLAMYCCHAFTATTALIETVEKLDKRVCRDTFVFKVLAIGSFLFGVYKFCSKH